ETGNRAAAPYPHALFGFTLHLGRLAQGKLHGRAVLYLHLDPLPVEKLEEGTGRKLPVLRGPGVDAAQGEDLRAVLLGTELTQVNIRIHLDLHPAVAERGLGHDSDDIDPIPHAADDKGRRPEIGIRGSGPDAGKERPVYQVLAG